MRIGNMKLKSKTKSVGFLYFYLGTVLIYPPNYMRVKIFHLVQFYLLDVKRHVMKRKSSIKRKTQN
jgi:hypothetical protein